MIARVLALRHNPLKAELAGMLKHKRAILLDAERPLSVLTLKRHRRQAPLGPVQCFCFRGRLILLENIRNARLQLGDAVTRHLGRPLRIHCLRTTY
jgi:hypothetical protein